MGLLDQINEVLNVTPRKYWGEKANRLGSLLSDAASSGAEGYASASGPLSPQHAQTLGGLLADFTPVVGDVKSAYDGIQSAREGDYLGAALGGLGALPMVPNLGGIVRGGKMADALNVTHGDKIDADLMEGANVILSKLVAKNKNAGDGTAFMQDLARLADEQGRTVALSPATDFGGNKKRLEEFYRRFGFVPNKGRNKDFAISETMLREPK